MNDLAGIILPEGLPTPIVTCEIEGILEADDLRELALTGGESQQPSAEVEDPSNLKRIKEKHHSVARMCSSGLSQRMVAQLCGYTESYLSILLNSPAMQELVELYRIQNGAAANLITEKLRTVGLKALERLDERIDEDSLDNNELLGAAKLGMDRAGHGPSSTSHNVTEQHIIDHAEIQRRNREAQERSAQYIVPASEVRAVLEAPKEQQDETDGKVGS